MQKSEVVKFAGVDVEVIWEREPADYGDGFIIGATNELLWIKLNGNDITESLTWDAQERLLEAATKP